MAIKDIFKVSRKTFFDPRGWADYDLAKVQSRELWNSSKNVLNTHIPEPEHVETFDQAMQRLNVKEEELSDISSTYLFFAGLFALFGLSMFGLTLVLLWGFYIAGAALATAFSVFLFSQAFQYHFWYFQIKHRKLGCTFDEWRRGWLDRGQS